MVNEAPAPWVTIEAPWNPLDQTEPEWPHELPLSSTFLQIRERQSLLLAVAAKFPLCELLLDCNVLSAEHATSWTLLMYVSPEKNSSSVMSSA
jgi:hypothetical protein